MSGLTAPSAPGRLGEQIDPAALQVYLGALEAWVRGRRAELSDIDAAALTSPQREAIAGDVALALALWKAVADRFAVMWQTWDSGRVGTSERERLSQLIWGRLDDAATANVAVSVPESCRLCDALVTALRATLQLSPAGEEAVRRIASLRAQVERLRDQVALEPPQRRASADQTLAQIVSRVEEIRAKADRGADVGGLLGPLENTAAAFERDLIVGGVKRRETQAHLASVTATQAALEQRELEVRALAERAIAAVVPAPKYAVPQVAQIGSVPTNSAALADHQARLTRVGQAMDVVEQAYASALAEKEALTDAFAAAQTRAVDLGIADEEEIVAAHDAVAELLARRPVPVPVARAQIGVLVAWLDLAHAAAVRS